MSRRVLGFIAPIVGLAAMAPAAVSAGAQGAGAQGFTQHMHQADQIEYDHVPCTQLAVEVHDTNENGVFHVTALSNGTFWATGTFEGDFTALPISNDLVLQDPNNPDSNLVPVGPVSYDNSRPSYTGHFTVWFGDNNNLQNGSETSTFTIHATGSDGSTLDVHDTAHMSVSAGGVQSITFDKNSCS